MIDRLQSPASDELDELTTLWEASVRATHDFLVPGDIAFFRPLVRHEALPAAELWVIREVSGRFGAFLGIVDRKIEMLFVAPGLRGTGLGRKLVEHAFSLGIRHVDVNEQNTAAAAFYARMGFRVVSRDAVDASGRPYPILHLEA